MAAKKKFSPAQLRNQKRFAAAAKARSKAAKKKNSGKAKSGSVSVVRNGKKLYGAAAQAVLAKRNSKKTSKVKNSSKKGSTKKATNKSPRAIPAKANKKKKGLFAGAKTAMRRGKSRARGLRALRGKRVRFNNPFYFPSRRNSASENFELFQGRPSTETLLLPVPGDCPEKGLWALGELGFIETDNEKMEFSEGEAYLIADKENRLWVSGDVHLEPMENLGQVQKVSYITQKDHISPGELVEWVHKMGEDGGKQPALITDGSGMLHLVGGDYEITPAGIVN